MADAQASGGGIAGRGLSCPRRNEPIVFARVMRSVMCRTTVRLSRPARPLVVAFGGQERIVLLSALVLYGVPDKAELVVRATWAGAVGIYWTPSISSDRIDSIVDHPVAAAWEASIL